MAGVGKLSDGLKILKRGGRIAQGNRLLRWLLQAA